jgi:hypothetical protein
VPGYRLQLLVAMAHEDLTRENVAEASTELDALAIGNCYLRKDAQDPALKRNYESAFELD